MKKEYTSYTIEDFALDVDFRRWIIQPTEKDHLFWQNFLNSYPEKQYEIEQASAIVKAIEIKPVPFPKETKNRIRKILQEKNLEINKSKASKKVIKRVRWQLAATIAILIASSAIYFWPASQKDQLISIPTTFGEIKNIQLPDGSEVTINGNSTLKYDPNWEERIVYLDGEAFFKVKPQMENNTLRKFAVKTNGMEVSVVGTQFNVNARNEKTKVILNEGKVCIKTPLDTLTLKPGEMITYEKEVGTLKPVKVDSEAKTSWKDQLILFKKEKLGNIFERWRQTYGYDITVKSSAESLNKREVQLSVPRDSIHVLFKKLERLYNLKVKYEGEKKITIE